MKKLKMLLLGIIISLLLVACGNRTANVENEQLKDMNNSRDEMDNSVEESEKVNDDLEEIDVVEPDKYTEPTDITKYLMFSASSELDGGDYGIQNLSDGDISTAWVEGVAGNGEGESITVTSDYNFMITSLEINNGYQKSDSILIANSQPSVLEINLDSGGSHSYNLEQSISVGEIQKIELSELRELDLEKITITIQDIYEGSQYNDTCISEVKVYGYIGDINPNHTKFATEIELEEVYIEDYNAVALITAKNIDGDVVWTYESESYPLTELDCSKSIGIIDDKYIFIVSGTVTALDVSTGAIIWESENSAGAGNSFDFDSHNNLYVSGYYGPDLLVIDSDGNTLYYYSSLSDLYWPFKVNYEAEMVYITYGCEVESITIKVNPKTGETWSLE